MIYWIAHGIVTVLSKILCPVKVIGFENVPSQGNVILASNHVSNLDPMIIGLACSKRLSYVAKESLFKNSVFSFFLHQVGAFPIRRESSDIGAIKEALKRLKQGGRIVIFPSGTRMTKAAENKVQPGIALLAVKSRATVLPTFIQGSDKVLPAGSKCIKPGPITVVFGKPVEYTGMESYQAMADRIMQEINSLSALLPAS